MITSYILILAFSAWLIAACATRAAERITRAMGVERLIPAGVIILTTAVLFFTVVGASAVMLTGTVTILITCWLHTRYPLPTLALWAIPFLAAFFAIHPSHLPVIASVPPIALQAMCCIILYAVIWGARALPYEPEAYALPLLSPLVPLIIAPWLSTAPSYIALDAALIAASFLGGVMASTKPATMGLARAPFTLLLGWLMLQPALHGAWIFSVLSLLIYGGYVAHGLTQHYVDPSDA